MYKIQETYDSIMYECFCIEFIDFMFKGKSLADFSNLVLPNSFENNEKVILNYLFELKLI